METNTDCKGRFSCPHCKKIFSANRSVRYHVKKYHVGCELPPCLKSGRHLSDEISSGQLIVCLVCSRHFLTSAALSRHSLRYHGIVVDGQKNEKDNVTEERQLQFNTLAEFENWKSIEEAASSVMYVRRRMDKMNKRGAIIRTYYCHRSGVPAQVVSGAARRRQMKSKGSCRIGANCPSLIKLNILPSGNVSVNYLPTHSGHTCDVTHLRLSKEQRTRLASMLSTGSSYDDILSTVNSAHMVSSTDGPVSPLRLLTRKDLDNIRRDFKISRTTNPEEGGGTTDCLNGSNQSLFVDEAERHAAFLKASLMESFPLSEVILDQLTVLKSVVIALKSNPEHINRLLDNY